MSDDRILVTGAGGIAGVNFVRALRASARRYYVAGTEHNRYYIQVPDLHARFPTPRHDSPDFVPEVSRIAREEKIDFVHPQPSSEALVLSENRGKVPAKLFLPKAETMVTGQDKLLTQERLISASVAVARTWKVSTLADLDAPFDDEEPPLWVRARHGAGGRLSLACGSAEEARDWVGLWAKRGTPVDEFIVQEYLPGRNIAWDSIWRDGKLVTSYCRERLEYPLKHVSPSGITGTPSVSRIVHDDRVNKAGSKSVIAVAERPDGAFSIDMKEDIDGRPCVTEVDAGKFHTTMPLWGYVGIRHLKLPWFSNLADLYVRLGLGEDEPPDVPPTDLFPAGYYLIRNIDSGVLLWREDGLKEWVLRA